MKNRIASRMSAAYVIVRSMATRQSRGILAALVVLAMGMAFTGCSPEIPDYAGTYQLTSMEIGGKYLTGAELEATYESSGGVESYYIEIKDSRTLIASLDGHVEEVAYVAVDNVLTVQETSGPSSFVLDGDTLTWEVSDHQAAVAMDGAGRGFTMVFTRS